MSFFFDALFIGPHSLPSGHKKLPLVGIMYRNLTIGTTDNSILSTDLLRHYLAGLLNSIHPHA